MRDLTTAVAMPGGEAGRPPGPGRQLFRPRALLLDLFDTLVPAMTSVALAPGCEIPPTWEDLGISADDYRRRWLQDGDGRATGRVRDPVEVLRLVAQDIDPGIPLDRIAWAAERRGRRFVHVLTQVDPAVVEAVARIRAAGVRTALVSNACYGEIEAWPDSPLAAQFDATLFSCQVGAAKPEPAIYGAALGALEVTAGEALFAGDGNSDELAGARAVGLATALISGYARVRWAHTLAERRAHADWEFASVPELVAALEGLAGG